MLFKKQSRLSHSDRQGSRWTLLMLGMVALGSGRLEADPVQVPVVNHSFEDISTENPVNEFTFGSLPGWQVYDPDGIAANGTGGTGIYVGTLTPQEHFSQPGVIQNFPEGAPHGQRVAIAFGYENTDGVGEYGLEQELGETLTANSTYTLQVEICNIATGIAQSGQTFFLDGMPTYRVQLVANGVVLAEDNNTLAGTIPEGDHATSTIVLEVGEEHPQLGEALTIRLINVNLAGDTPEGHDIEIDFDDVRLTREEVEPAELLPVLVVVAQEDVWYADYSGTIDGLADQGVEYVTASATTGPATSHWGSGYGEDGGVINPDISIVDANASDYSAIVFTGGWGMAMFQNTEALYNNPAYNGLPEMRNAVSDLIDDFLAQDKVVSALCYGSSVLVEHDVNGQSLMDGRFMTGWQGAAPADDQPGQNTLQFRAEQRGALMFESGSVGNPTTSTDDVVIDGRIITAENQDSAFYFGQVVAVQVILDTMAE